MYECKTIKVDEKNQKVFEVSLPNLEDELKLELFLEKTKNMTLNELERRLS